MLARTCRYSQLQCALARQITLFGRSIIGMPAPWVYEGSDGELILYNGVTRATRVAKLSPGTRIQVEVIGKLARAFADRPTGRK